MLDRALETITDEAVDTVLELINQNSIYRGAEHLAVVQRFKNMVGRSKLFRNSRDVFVWKELEAGDQAVNFIRNSVIGTLLVDLSEGVSLDRAVASFESKVAPANYKRPTALVTKAMIESAKKKVAELGLLSALERRYATIDDIKINDILFANATARRTIVKDVFEELAGTVKANPKLDKVEEVTIEKFIADIMPTATGIELLVENRHAGNLVSLIAPVDPTAPGMFKWNNNFSWSYNGNMADSIKERVKAAGGNVTGELCCRLAWDYTDDLDFHMLEPDYHLFYSQQEDAERWHLGRGRQLQHKPPQRTPRGEHLLHDHIEDEAGGVSASSAELLPQVRRSRLHRGDRPVRHRPQLRVRQSGGNTPAC
jgi:hypothetical protein